MLNCNERNGERAVRPSICFYRCEVSMSVSTLNRILTVEISPESNVMSPQITEGEDTAVSVTMALLYSLRMRGRGQL
jgi:hypothetical protein